MWTKFCDLSSGGYEKTDWSIIYIKLQMEEAIEYFKSKFGINPFDVACPCCGSDFSVYEVDECDVFGGETCLIINKEDL